MVESLKKRLEVARAHAENIKSANKTNNKTENDYNKSKKNSQDIRHQHQHRNKHHNKNRERHENRQTASNISDEEDQRHSHQNVSSLNKIKILRIYF